MKKDYKKNMLSKDDINLLKKAFQYSKPYIGKIIFVVILIILGTSIALIRPILWAKVLTQLYERDYSNFLTTIIYMMVLYLSLTTINSIQSIIVTRINSGMIYDLKKDFYKKVINMRIEVFDKMSSGEITARLYNDVNEIVRLVTNQLLSTIIDFIKIVVIGIAIIKINFYLSLIVLCTFPISLMISKKFAHIFRKENAEIKKIHDNYYSITQESVIKIKEIKSLNLVQKFFVKYEKIATEYKNKSIRIANFSLGAGVINGAVGFISELLIFIVAGYHIFIGYMNVEKFIAFNTYYRQFTQSLMNLVNINPRIQSVMSSLERIFSILDNLEESNELFGNEEIESIEGKIEFNNVRFSYNDKIEVLKGLDININKNSKVALVGESGSGKSTIFNLLLKFYDFKEGDIFIDDKNIKSLNTNKLRENISVITQEPEVFSMSIIDNITIVNENISLKEAIEACKRVGINEFIEALPLKYDTMLGPGGIKLSVGQKQRLAIARALVKKSKIILLDEATSALDNNSQKKITDLVAEMTKDHTVIVIAHRLKTILDSDMIIVMNEGEIVGKGTHAALLASCETYRKLISSDFASSIAV